MMNTKIRLTKVYGQKSHSSSLQDGQSVEGFISDKGWGFPKVPTVGYPFVISSYRTSTVKTIINDAIFETENSRYHWVQMQ